jgi:aldehyde dehydrogenase (NAD+)
MLFSPWSDPLRRAILPLIASVAAGNCTLLKLSEHVPHVSELLAALLDRYFDREYIAAWTDTFEAVSAIRREPLGLVYFTGGSAAARIVCRAAAAQLTPVITDIGGKSPCIVDASADLRRAAHRIAAAKLRSAGQTFAAPDDLFIERRVKAEFLTRIREAHDRLYTASPCENPQYPKIVNRMHFERLKQHLSDGRLLFGGDVCEESCRIALTLMDHIAPGSVLRSEEIFGPILPVHTFDDIDSVIRTLRRRAKPPALYLFSRDRTLTHRMLLSLEYGTACVNDVPLHGMAGCPHGKEGFDLFSIGAAVRSGRHFL